MVYESANHQGGGGLTRSLVVYSPIMQCRVFLERCESSLSLSLF